ncbi:MAG: D-2-hydroxyacid dehydrogenase [Burkholderiales bacterium]|nr:D-2-hydroxyacid dehydrogenase [Burkholderiales bacterium]
MATSVLIIDPKCEWYRERLAQAVPAAEIRCAPDARAAAPLVGDTQAILGMGHHFSDALIAPAKRLRWIQAFTTGVDQIVSLSSLRKDVLLTAMRGIHGTQLSEMVFLHMLVHSRSYRALTRNQERALWEKHPQQRLAGKTVVIVGVGLIAEALAPRCKAFEMSVIGVTSAPRALPGFDRMMKREALQAAAALADFLVVLAPLTPENEKLISARVIAAMKPTAFIVNVARGPVVDEQALLEAVRAGRLGGAGLDVFSREPLPPEHPFWGEERIVITPRQAGGTVDYHELALPTVEKNLKLFCEGRLSEMLNICPH